jgi:cellulose synthase/poly-beta-1,6-N-acetylglucosamine synthase-like glycosyltransferase
LVANIDADTKLPKGWLEKVQNEFANDENLVAISGPYVYYDLPKISSAVVEFWYRVGYITNYVNQIFKKGAMLQGGNFVLRRSALEKIGGFDTSIDFFGEDTDIARRISAVGRVKFTFTLKMPTSARRFKKDGLVLAGWKYFINYLWILFFKKPFTKEYESVQ